FGVQRSFQIVHHRQQLRGNIGNHTVVRLGSFSFNPFSIVVEIRLAARETILELSIFSFYPLQLRASRNQLGLIRPTARLFRLDVGRRKKVFLGETLVGKGNFLAFVVGIFCVHVVGLVLGRTAFVVSVRKLDWDAV